MRRTALISWLSIVSIVFAVIIWVAVDHNSRRFIMTRITPAYTLYQLMSVRNEIRKRNFSAVGSHLNTYLDTAQRFSSGRSGLLSGLMEVTEIALEPVRLQSEYNELLPALRRLAEMEPSSYLAHTWLAEAIVRIQPEEALKHAKEAIRLVGTYDRAHRVGLDAAVRLNDDGLIGSLCQDYYTNQYGGLRHKNFFTLYHSTGLRHLGFQAQLGENDSYIAGNFGLQLNERTTYDFYFPDTLISDRFVLHLGIVPGVLIVLHQVTFKDGGDTFLYNPSNLIITSRTGFVTGHTSSGINIHSLGSGDEAIGIQIASGIEQQFDSAALDMTFYRIPLSNHPACMKNTWY